MTKINGEQGDSFAQCVAKTKIKVISLKQPWAQLMVMGAKRIETRSFQTKYRGELYIHASQTIDRHAVDLCRFNSWFHKYTPDFMSLKKGYIVGRVLLMSIEKAEYLRSEKGFMSGREFQFGDYSDGRYAWKCAPNMQEFTKPIACPGKLGIWEYEVSEALLNEAIQSAIERGGLHGAV